MCSVDVSSSVLPAELNPRPLASLESPQGSKAWQQLQAACAIRFALSATYQLAYVNKHANGSMTYTQSTCHEHAA